MNNQENKVFRANINEINFHPLLKDIENIFWFFIIANKALSHPDVQNILKAENDSTILSMLTKYNEWTKLKIERSGNHYNSKINIKSWSIFFGKMMAIIAYEFLVSLKYIGSIEDTEEFKFLKYIRNSAAHDNKFNFKYNYGWKKGKWMIGEKEVIKWGNLEISRKLQDKEVFEEFMPFSIMFLLVKSFSDKLIEIDKNSPEK